MMNRPSWLPLAGAASLLAACASINADRFYALQPVPATASPPRQQFAAEVSVRVTVPSMVDRSQMVLQKGNAVVVLEHERWASPLVDQINAVLGRDIEYRRPDVLVTLRPTQGAGIARIAVQVDIVALTLRSDGPVTMSARWRLDAPGAPVKTGREEFSVSTDGAAPASLATALSGCASALADRIATQLPPLQFGPQP